MRLTHIPRPATEDDLEKVAEIEAKSILPPWKTEAFAAELKKSHSHFWVLTDEETDQNIIGYLVFHFPAEQAHLLTYAIDPHHRRQGWGKILLRQMISFVIRNGGQSLILEVRKGNTAAVQLYQSLGFVVIRTLPRFYPDGEDGFVMLYSTEQKKLTGDPDFDSDDGNGTKNFI